MKINNQIDLFFQTSINDMRIRTRPRHPHRNLLGGGVFQRLENKADSFLSESRYWLRGKEINLYDKKAVANPIKKRFNSSIDKIKSIAQAIFYFLPGTILKAFVWIYDFSYVKQRNAKVLELLRTQSQKQTDFMKDCSSIHLIPSKTFTKERILQTGSLATLPKELINLILIELNDQDLTSFALTCKENYLTVEEFLCKPAFLFNRYPPLIVKAMGTEKFCQIPFSRLDGAWQAIFEKSQTFVDFFEQDINITAAVNEIELLMFDIEDIEIEKKEIQFSSLMQNDPIQRIQFKNRNALIFRIRNNLDKQEYTFVITKFKNKWMVVAYKLPPSIWLFLNDLRYHEEAPKVLDYLSRLFNGEPCGCFPENLNSTIEVNYQQNKASELLQEGPLVCEDGITPVIQLWPAISKA